MKTGLQQAARLGQELKVNPRLYQAMDMLYMPLLDLQQHLKQELMSNPFLELVEPEEEEAEAGEETAAEADAQAEAEQPETPERADSDDESQWEDILLNGFDVGGQREERDDREHFEPTTVATRGLDDHLREQIRLLDLSDREERLAEELPGILQWAIDGCLNWQAHGLGMPESVRQATGEYVAEMDPVKAFIGEACITGSGNFEASRKLHRAYQKWCEETGEHAIREREFCKQLDRLGHPVTRGGASNFRRGIRLKTAEEVEQERLEARLHAEQA